MFQTGFENSYKRQNTISIQLDENEITNQAEMFYITSMIWKIYGQKYYRYTNNVVPLFLG